MKDKERESNVNTPLLKPINSSNELKESKEVRKYSWGDFYQGLLLSRLRIFLAVNVFVGLCIVYILRINLSVAIIPMSAEFGWDSSFQSVILSSFFWGYVPIQIVGGISATRFGGKVTLACGIVGASVFTVLLPFLTTEYYRDYLIIISRIITGLFEGVCFPTVHNLSSRWFREDERATYIAFMWSGSFAGVSIADAVSPHIIDRFGWKFVFFIFGGLVVPWVISWIIFASQGPEMSIWISKEELQDIRNGQKGSVKVEQDETIPWSVFFSNAGLWAIIANNFLQSWGYYTNLMWLPTYMNNDLHYSLKQSGLFSFLPVFFQFVVMLVSSKISDILVSREIFDPTKIRKGVVIIGGVFPPLITVLLCFDLRPELYVILITLSGAIGGVVVANSTNYMDLSPKFAGILYGIGNTSSSIPGILATLVVGQVLQRWNCWCAVWMMASITNITGTIVYLCFGTAKPLNIPKYEKDNVDEVESISP